MKILDIILLIQQQQPKYETEIEYISNQIKKQNV